MNYSLFSETVKLNGNRFTDSGYRCTVIKTSLNTRRIKKVIGKTFIMECPVCHVCHVFHAMELDHINPQYNGGASENDNECFICPICHNEKSDLERKGKTGSARYLQIQARERASKKANMIFYTFLEYISHANEKNINEHPRYILRMILSKLISLFNIVKNSIMKLLKVFSNKFTLRKAEVRCLLESNYYDTILA